MATFSEIKSKLSDSGAKNDKAITDALALLPIRIVLEMDATELATFAQNFHDAQRKVYLNATRR